MKGNDHLYRVQWTEKFFWWEIIRDNNFVSFKRCCSQSVVCNESLKIGWLRVRKWD